MFCILLQSRRCLPFILNRYFEQLEDGVKAKFVQVVLRGGRGFIVNTVNKQSNSEIKSSYRNTLFMYIVCIASH